MPKDYKELVLRVIDANFNRYKEGLRVVEDIMRFILQNEEFQKEIKKLRHGIDILLKEKKIKDAIIFRNADIDFGKKVDVFEIKRKDYFEVLYINLQRSKESLRVIEEFLKIISPKLTNIIKKMRYNLYSVEKRIYIYFQNKK